MNRIANSSELAILTHEETRPKTFPVALEIFSQHFSIHAVQQHPFSKAGQVIIKLHDTGGLSGWGGDSAEEVNKIISALIEARDYAFGGEP